MNGGISALIPTRNDICLPLVESLVESAGRAGLEEFEVVVVDDGSDMEEVKSANKAVGGLPGCRYVEIGRNVGRGAARNRLAGLARYGRLLFLDADNGICDKDFIGRYAAAVGEVVCGGVAVPDRLPGMEGNLRYAYERSVSNGRTAEARSKRPYCNFTTANFMISRELFGKMPFDECLRSYGYEDVLMGKRLEDAGAVLSHIANPVVFTVFEPNGVFVSKTIQALDNLYAIRDVIGIHSKLLNYCRAMSRIGAARAAYSALSLFKGRMQRNIEGGNPSVAVFQFYKLYRLLGLMLCRVQPIS